MPPEEKETIDDIIDDAFEDEEEEETEEEESKGDDDSEEESKEEKGEKPKAKAPDKKKEEPAKKDKPLAAIPEDADADDRAFMAGEILASIRDELNETFGSVLPKEAIKDILTQCRASGVKNIANLYNAGTHTILADAKVNQLRREGKLKEQKSTTNMRDKTSVGNTTAKEKAPKGLSYALGKFSHDPKLVAKLKEKGVMK